MSQKFQHGAFTFYRTAATCQPMTPADIERLAARHTMPTAIIPAYSGDRNQVMRAIAQVSTVVSRQGWKVEAIKRTQHEIVYGIVHCEINQREEKLRYDQDSVLRWSDEGGNGAYVEGMHEIACQVNTAYQQLRGKICAGDWTESVCNYLSDTCRGQMIRPAVYYVPPSTLPQVHSLTAFLADVGLQLLVCEIEAEAVSVVQQAASEGLQEQLAALQEQVAQFDGKQKPSNYAARLAEIEQLRGRALAYQAALGIGVQQTQAVLDSLKAQVAGLLDVRKRTVVHRSGRTSGAGTPGSTPVDTLAQAFQAAPTGTGCIRCGQGHMTGIQKVCGQCVMEAEAVATQARAAGLTCQPLDGIATAPLASALGKVRAQVSLW